MLPWPSPHLRSLLTAMAMLLAGAALRAQAGDPSTLRMSALQEEASQLVEQQQFAAALPFLQEVERRMGNTDSVEVRAAKDDLWYFLGLAQLQVGDYTAAAEVLAKHRATYGSSRHQAGVLRFLGDAHYYQRQFAAARAAYEALLPLIDQAGLEPRQRLTVWERLSDCCFAASDWAAGQVVFESLAREASRQTDLVAAERARTKAASYRLQGAIAQDDMATALATLPLLSAAGGAARYDVALNLALVRGGDQLFAANRFGEAIFFYQQVVLPSALAVYWDQQVAQLAAEEARLQGVWMLANRRSEVSVALGAARQRRDQVAGTVEAGEGNYAASLLFRVARCYLATDRPFEGYWAFTRLAEAGDLPGAEAFYEEAVYGQVKMAVAAGFGERAAAAAETYLAQGDFRAFLGDVAYERIQIAQANHEPDRARELCLDLAARLRAEPIMREGPKLVYLIGSTLLAEEEYQPLQDTLANLRAGGEEGGYADGLIYWPTLAALYEGEYGDAQTQFSTLVETYPESSYAEDARYRIGVCLYGRSKLREAEASLTEFLAQYPDSPLVCEAQVLLGDVAASERRVVDALGAYRAAIEAGAKLQPPNQPYIDHATFQGGTLLAGEKRWQETAHWYQAYIDRFGAAGRYGDAIYSLGQAQEALGQPEAMLESYFTAILRFGDDPNDGGPDLMLTEYPEKYAAHHGELPIPQLRDAWRVADSMGQRTLALRLSYTLGRIDPTWELAAQPSLEDIVRASPAVLVAMAERSRATHAELALAAAERVVSLFGETPWAEEAWQLLGELRAPTDPAGAIAAYEEAAIRFPASPRTVRARLAQGDLYRAQGDPLNALAVYKKVLETRAWRGEAWAEATFKSGLAHLQLQKPKVAFGFFQQVYVLYAGFPEWAAQAYVQSGIALERLSRPQDAAATYRELLANEKLAGLPVAQQARERLEALP